MNNTDISVLLNNTGINRLADFYLDFLGLDRSSQTYRRLKNATICALKFDNVHEIYSMLESVDDGSAAEIERDIAAAINNLPEPIEDMFNRAYCYDAKPGFMPHYKTTDNIVGFLGKTLLYILETNYFDLLLLEKK